MKEWIKSFLPFRWVFPFLFIFLMGWLIYTGFIAKDMYENDIVYFVGSQWMWQLGNVIFILFVDYGFGLGREGNFFRIK